MDAYLLKGVILFLFFCFNLFVEKQNIFLYILFCVFFIYRVCIVLSIYGVDWPGGITFNNDFTKLFIINEGETVLVYSCKWKILYFFVNEGFLYFSIWWQPVYVVCSIYVYMTLLIHSQSSSPSWYVVSIYNVAI
jgi:hypothetical protein